MTMPRSDKSTLLAALLLVASVGYNLVGLYPEIALDTPDLNDNALHYTLVQRAAEALERGEDPTDPWVPTFVQGYPLFHHYQHLPHVTTALLYRALGGAIPLRTVFKALGYLLLSSFPLSIYWTGRRLGFRPLPAALAGLTASLLATDGLYGLDYASYVWRGYGMTTQLWGMWLLGPALGGMVTTVRDGRAYAGTTVLLAATLLSHTVLGYVALVSGALIVLLAPRSELWRRAGRLAVLLILVAVAASYFLVPFVVDRPYLNRSVWETPGKYDAYGWEWTLKALVTGELLDYNRFPALTVLAALGLVVCVSRWRQAEHYRLLVLFFGFWLCLYFGRPTWGVLLDLLPMSRDLHLHRLIAPVHLGAIGLTGAGLAWLGEQVLARRQRWQVAGAGLLTLALLAPVYRERAEYLATNAQWRREDMAAFQADGGAMEALLADLVARPPGRVYAGRSATWGAEYKIGSVPVYTLLAVNQFDNPGYLYHALSLNADIEGYLDEARPATFDLFNLRYVVAPADQSAPVFARPLAAYGRHRLYGVETSGYFDLVDSDMTWYGDRSEWFTAAQAWIQSDLVELGQHPAVVWGSAPAGEGASLPLSAVPGSLTSSSAARQPCGRILSEQVEGNSYTVEFEAGRTCWLLLKATYHPGWQATLDGRPVPTQMLAPSFLGVQVGPGQHRAEVVYSPGPLRAWLRLAGLAVVALSAMVEWRWGGWKQRARRVADWLAGPQTVLRQAGGWLSSSPLARWSRDARWLAALLVLAVLAGLPMLQLKVMNGHDAFEYLPRTIEFYRGLEEGQIFPRWAPDLGGGHGYPFFIFNPPLIYYAASAFHALGLSVVASLDLACLALLALGGLGMALLAREFFGKAGGLAAGVGYVFSPFTLVNLYVRHAFADYAAMAFIPWAFWGLFRWAQPQSARRREVHLLSAAGAVALLTLSSNPVALVTVPALVLYAGFLAWRAKSWRGLGRGLWAVCLGLGLAAFFWLPALGERNWVRTDRLLSGYLNYRNHFVHLPQYLHSPWGYGLSLPGPEDGMSFGLGPVYLILLVASVVVAWRLRNRPDGTERGREQLWFFVGLLGLALFLAADVSAWLWDALPLLHYLEFPWRILVLAAVATAFACGFPFLVVREPERRRWCLAIVLAGLFLTGMPHAKPEAYYETADAEYAPEIIAERGLAVTTAREYEPVWVATRPDRPAPASRLLLLEGQVRVLESELSGTSYTWVLEVSKPAQLRVATFFYPGWHLTVDSQPRSLSIRNPYGLMDFSLEAGVHRVELDFGTTPLRTGAAWTSGGALLLALLTVIWHRRRRRPPRRDPSPRLRVPAAVDD
jgi:hypothetical protein